MNRVLKNILAKVTEPINNADWKKKLTAVEFTINNTVHCASKQTQSQLLFGAEQRAEQVDELTKYLHDVYTKTIENL